MLHTLLNDRLPSLNHFMHLVKQGTNGKVTGRKEGFSKNSSITKDFFVESNRIYYSFDIFHVVLLFLPQKNLAFPKIACNTDAKPPRWGASHEYFPLDAAPRCPPPCSSPTTQGVFGVKNLHEVLGNSWDESTFHDCITY